MGPVSCNKVSLKSTSFVKVGNIGTEFLQASEIETRLETEGAIL